MKEPTLTLGVEEEYLVVEPETGELIESLPESMLAECEALAGGQQVTPEYLRSQIEIGTRVCRNIAEVRESLANQAVDDTLAELADATPELLGARFVELGLSEPEPESVPPLGYARSKRSAFMTFVQAATKSVTNFSALSSWA